MSEARKRLRVYVSGRVQGVCFRACTCNEAFRFGVGGYARNLHDGRVEVVMEGTEAQLNQLLEYIKEGPVHAHVSGVEIIEEGPTGEFSQFSVVR
ncbi:MAG: acylphosphatase [Deltaproteobacteria bacterium]|nr:acylphosphatase [Deltaproteobacteria bacterium]